MLTLTVFLTALSIGYWLAGRYSSRIKNRELLFYGGVEAVIGLWAVIFPFLFKFSFYLVAAGWLEQIYGDILLSVLLTALPATLMGTTLPFLTQGMSRSFHSASRTHALVYATNTFGACLGTILTGFVLINAIGLDASLFSIGSLNIAFGLSMVYLSRKLSSDNNSSYPLTEIANKTSTQHRIPVNKVALLTVAACSGYLLIAIESYFIRLFSIATDGSSHAYPTVVTAFIAAVGIGAAVSGRLMHKAHKLYALLPLLVLMLWLVIYYTIPYWPYADYLLKHYTIHWLADYSYLPAMRFLSLFLLIGLPVAFSSMLLPFSFHFFKNRGTSLGESTGTLYAVATIATIFGGLVGGFFVFKWLDFQSVFISHLLVICLVSLATAIAIKTSWKGILGLILILSIASSSVLLVSAKDFEQNLALSFYFQTPTQTDEQIATRSEARKWLWEWFDYEQIIATSHQPEGSVSVFEKNPTDRMIAINGRSNSRTTGADFQGNALLSLFPYMLTESPKRVLVIGLGTGVTAGAIANQANVEIVDVCEINSAVSEQLKHFDFATFDASTNSKINIIPADVVKYLLRSPQQYDIIVSIPSNFWVAGMENLMTPEFYEIANQNLAVGGTFIQWIPEYGFSEPGLLMLIRSFMSSFDSSSMWRLTQNDLILMYQKDSADFHQWLDKRLLEPIFLDTMDKIDFFSPKSLIYAQIAGPELLSQLAPKGKVHSLNKPGLGITALQALYHPDAKYSAENTIHRLTREHAAQLKTSTQLEPKPASPGKSANKSKFILNAVDNES